MWMPDDKKDIYTDNSLNDGLKFSWLGYSSLPEGRKTAALLRLFPSSDLYDVSRQEQINIPNITQL